MAQRSDRDANWALRERFAQVHDQYSRLRSGMGEMQAKLHAYRATEKSRDGLIKVSVDARGRLVKLELEPAALRSYSATALAEEITRVVTKAGESAGAGVNAIMAEVMPADSGALSFLRTNDMNDLMKRQDDIMDYRPEQRDER
ncbi:YbaB/EbfC family nucleoid-associated protein [Catellatospora sp. NPDC049609]|uniref:YbaB/EbfC family nucleoid-associated protein n=1 Tax=Catellatospora sp. NPDC049609 TaxID=3155505 RepID=UPI0034264BA2